MPVIRPTRPVPSVTKNSSERSDVRILIDRIQGGDTTAFAAIYRHFKPVVAGVVHSRVDDRHQAEDLISDTFARAWAAIQDVQWRSDAEFTAWLVTIAKNLVTNHFQRSGTRLVTVSPRAGTHLVDHFNAEAAPESTVVGHTELMAALRQLGPRQREVVVHRILLDRSVEQTAGLLGCHESVVKHALRKALRRLGVLLRPVEAAVA